MFVKRVVCGVFSLVFLVCVVPARAGSCHGEATVAKYWVEEGDKFKVKFDVSASKECASFHIVYKISYVSMDGTAREMTGRTWSYCLKSSDKQLVGDERGGPLCGKDKPCKIDDVSVSEVTCN